MASRMFLSCKSSARNFPVDPCRTPLLPGVHASAPDIYDLAQTIETWQAPMVLAITTGLSDACSEGYNRIVKHVGRIAFGFCNPDNQETPSTVGLHPPITAGATQDQTTTPLLSR